MNKSRRIAKSIIRRPGDGIQIHRARQDDTPWYSLPILVGHRITRRVLSVLGLTLIAISLAPPTGAQTANKALKEGLSFPDTLRAMQPAGTQMPGYGELIETVNAQHGSEGNSMEVASIDDINRYRDLLGQAGLTGQPYVPHEAKFESEEMVAAQALPGRRFSRETMCRGWLYVNTWYMIGPWESYGRNDFSITHPPEQGIDLDAVYHDGKTGPCHFQPAFWQSSSCATPASNLPR